MKLSDLIIDPASLGKRFWLVDVIPSYAYQNGQRTDTVTGYRYTVALPDKGLDKINVRIDGDQQMDAPASFVEVRFAELEPYLYTLTVGDKPVYIPAGGLSQKPYGTLFGRPVVPLEQCSAAGEVGDIILADVGQYLLIDKGGMKAASSIHVRFLYDENVFRFIYRVDGKPIWNKPLTPYKGSASVSPFVTLAKRNA